MKKLIGSWELSGLDEASLDRVLSFANLDAGIALGEAMSEGSYPATFSHAKVIMSLEYHGIELFLKYGIRRKTGNTPLSHYLRELRSEYESLYPENRFHFDAPFITHYLGFASEDVAKKLDEEQKDKSRGDQRLRYHLSRNGKQWEGADGLRPESYLSKLMDLKKQLLALSDMIEKEFGQPVASADGP